MWAEAEAKPVEYPNQDEAALPIAETTAPLLVTHNIGFDEPTRTTVCECGVCGEGDSPCAAYFEAVRDEVTQTQLRPAALTTGHR